MNIDEYSLSVVSFKASHNSYNRKESLTEQLGWNEREPYQCGCTGLELDLFQSGNGVWDWKVAHALPTGNSPALSEYLKELQSWSVGNPGHRPVMVFFDLKNNPNKGAHAASFPGGLDGYVLGTMDRALLFCPGDLMAGAPDLLSGVKMRGWPKVGALRGKFLFCLTSGDLLSSYVKTDPGKRVFFGALKDLKKADNDHVIFNLRVNARNARDTLKPFRERPWLLSRVYGETMGISGGIDSEKDWKAALEAGANVLATDKVSNHKWAMVGGAPMVPRSG